MERIGEEATGLLHRENRVLDLNLSPGATRRILFTLVFFSGAAGLVYQVVWHRYLTILLGAQARATSLVLAIFLGGISLGYVVFGRWTRWKRWNLMFAYVMVELALGLWAFFFPHIFQGLFALMPKLYATLGVQSIVVDIVLSLILIGFPTFLMGGTLPLLTQGMSKDLDEASGTHAKIYGLNTVGACLGSLLAGYLLIPALGLAISCLLAGFINCLVAFFAYFLFAKYWKPNTPDTVVEKHGPLEGISVHTAILLAVGFCSGFYVLCLETVLIRLVGLSTGAADYNFTLIVSIFVFGLGVGSLLVRRIARYTEAHLFWNQVAVSGFLLLVYLSVDYWPYWVHLIRITFRDQVENFYLFQASWGLLFLLLLAVPVAFCGLVLPLCFHLLKDRKETLGYRVGQLYGLNTVGSVLGALLGGYVLLYFVNLDHLFKICIGITLVMMALSGYSYYVLRRPGRRAVALGSGVGGLVFIGLFLAPTFRKENYTQPFRQMVPIPNVSYQGADAFHRYLASSADIIFYKDGPNSTIAIGSQTSGGKEVSRTVFVNGKSDGNTRGDFHTMNLTGHIPALLARRLDRVAVVGFGTGITTGALLSYGEVGQVDLIEISETLIKNAHYFDQYNGGVSVNPRVKFHQMDAFRFLGGTTNEYDVVISEPSNPWVAGVENLYTMEFYDIAKQRLKKDGIYVQWLQGYAFEDSLFKMVMKTLTSQFKYVAVFQMMSADYALVASDVPLEYEDLVRGASRLEGNPAAKDRLKLSGITNYETVLALEVVPGPLTRTIAEGAERLILELPTLSHEATKASFVRATIDIDRIRRYYKEFYPAADHFLLRKFVMDGRFNKELFTAFKETFCQHAVGGNPRLCRETIVAEKLTDPASKALTQFPQYVPEPDARAINLYRGPVRKPASFTGEDLAQIQSAFNHYKKYFSPIAYLPFSPLLQAVDHCLGVVKREEELYGECLLQKAAVLEVVDPRDDAFLPVLNEFNDWFAFLPQTTKNYERFKAAKKVLDQLIEEIASKKKASAAAT